MGARGLYRTRGSASTLERAAASPGSTRSFRSGAGFPSKVAGVARPALVIVAVAAKLIDTSLFSSIATTDCVRTSNWLWGGTPHVPAIPCRLLGAIGAEDLAFWRRRRVLRAAAPATWRSTRAAGESAVCCCWALSLYDSWGIGVEQAAPLDAIERRRGYLTGYPRCSLCVARMTMEPAQMLVSYMRYRPPTRIPDWLPEVQFMCCADDNGACTDSCRRNGNWRETDSTARYFV
jgi:hypothetical protein